MQKTKIIILIYLTTILKDKNILKMFECETRRKIAAVFINLKTSSVIFSELRNNIFIILFRHSVAIKIRNCLIIKNVIMNLRL